MPRTFSSHQLTETMSTRQFPIFFTYLDDNKRIYVEGTTIPWSAVANHDEQAKRNHCDQNLERLAQRGGLGVCEAVAVIEDRRWTPMNPRAAYERLKKLVPEYQPKVTNRDKPTP